jgi:hypothetical protein
MPPYRVTLVAAIVLAATLRPMGPLAAQATDVVRQQIGDTTVVRTVDGSAWDDPQLVEDLRIGVLDGAEEYMFGNVTLIAVTSDGTIVVFDSHGPEIRRYSRDGVYLGLVGRAGAGPGEYRHPVAMQIGPGDRLYVWDPANTRISVYSPDGVFERSWQVPSGQWYAYNDLVVTTDGRIYVRVPVVRLGPMAEVQAARDESRPRGQRLLGYDSSGNAIDTVEAPAYLAAAEGPRGRFAPRLHWALTPSGAVVAGLSNSYSFDVIARGHVTRIQRDVPPVPTTAGEREQYDQLTECMRRTSPNSPAAKVPPTPPVKPAYRQLVPQPDGRVWVWRPVVSEEGPEPDMTGAHLPSCYPALVWGERRREFDVFEPSGQYLGRVILPRGSALRVARGELAWGIQTGDFDEHYVVRWRIRTGLH